MNKFEFPTNITPLNPSLYKPESLSLPNNKMLKCPNILSDTPFFNKNYQQMSVFQTHYPQIESTRLHIESRIKHLQQKLFSRKQATERVNHQQLQSNIANLYNMMRETADNQVILHQELSLIKSGVRMEAGSEERVYGLERERRQAKERTAGLERQLYEHQVREESRRGLGYELASNKRLLDLELDARISQYKANLQDDSRRIYENKMRGILSREELELESLRRDRDVFERSYRNLSSNDLTGSKNKYDTHCFGGNYYGNSFGSGKYQPMTDYKRQEYPDTSYRKSEDRTQPSPQKLMYEGLQRRETGGLEEGLSNQKSPNPEMYPPPSFKNHESNQSSEKRRYTRDDRSKQHNTLNIDDLKLRHKNKAAEPSKKQPQDNSNSDSLQNTKNLKPQKRLHRSQSFSQSIEKKRSISRKPYNNRPTSQIYTKYMNVKLSEKSPSKRRKQTLTKDEVEKNAYQRIRNRILTVWAVYQDSTLGNTKHQKDHLVNTYKLEVRLRNEMKKKMNSHQIVQKRFGFIVD